MNELDVRMMLQRASASVDGRDLAEIAWTGGRRRARRAKAAAAATVLVPVLTVGALFQAEYSLPVTGQAPSSDIPARTGAGDTWQSGLTLEQEARLPWADTPWNRTIDLHGDGVRPLSSNPVKSALALFGLLDDSPRPKVLVLGSDGQLRVIDNIKLEMTRDAGGNKAAPLDVTSLKPDGRQAAIAQPHAVVVVDLTTGSSRRYSVPGLNEHIRWHPDRDLLLVGDSSHTTLLDLNRGTSRSIRAAAADVAFDHGDGLTELRVQRGAVRVRNWASIGDGDQSHAVTVRAPILPVSGAMSARGSRVAVAAATTSPDGADADSGAIANAVFVVDWRRREPVVRTLSLAWGRPEDGTLRSIGCCQVVGWADDNTVIFSSAIHPGATRLLAWNHQTDQLARILETRGAATVSLPAQSGAP